MSENCCIFNPRVKNHEANVTNESKPKWLLTLNKTDTRMRYVFNVFFVEKADRFKREKCIKFVHFTRADVPPVSDVLTLLVCLLSCPCTWPFAFKFVLGR